MHRHAEDGSMERACGAVGILVEMGWGNAIALSCWAQVVACCLGTIAGCGLVALFSTLTWWAWQADPEEAYRLSVYCALWIPVILAQAVPLALAMSRRVQRLIAASHGYTMIGLVFWALAIHGDSTNTHLIALAACDILLSVLAE